MDLPYDVWRHVVSYLPNDYTRGLLGVNHTLFEIAMDELYATVEIRWLNDRTWWILLNLQNPMIASRVHCLRFSPGIADDFYFAWSQRDRRDRRDKWMIRAKKPFYDAFHIPMPYWHHKITVRVGGDKQSSLHDSITMLINALPALTHLSEFEDLQSGQDFIPAYDMKPFYCAGFSAFGSNLRKLVLRRKLGSFSEVLKLTPHLPCLQELKMTFVWVAYPRSEEFHSLEMRNTVAPFINRHRSTIQALSLISLGVVNLSPLFLALEMLPSLRQLEIRIPPDFTCWRNLSGFARFIRDHMGTLRHLIWSPVEAGYPLRFSSTQLMFGTWLLDNSVTLSQLKTLRIRTTNSDDFRSILVQCRNSVDSLVTLSLRGCFLSYCQVDNLASIFSSPPTSLVNLTIAVMVLTPQLICLLEERLSGLKELTIYTSGIQPPSESSFSDEMRLKFAYFPEWHLYDIGIWQASANAEPKRVDDRFMYMLAEFIPQVSSFWGRGYMSVT